MREKRHRIGWRSVLLSLLLLCSIALSGCGKRIVFTRGFGGEELFVVGNTECSLSEYKVLLLDLQTECEKTFGRGVWESESGDALRESIEQRALSEASRLEVMFLLAVQDNIMLTDAEETTAAEAEREYYAGLSDEEKKYLNIDEDTLARLFRLYALAEKVYSSIGSSFEERYNAFVQNLDYDLNETMWNSVTLLEGESVGDTPGFSSVYGQYFGGAESAAASSGQGSTE